MSEKKSRKTRLAFIAMATTYCLGVFNDNFFKQAAMLLAVTAGLSRLQGYATVLFALPFILFSAYGGWCADRFPKHRVIIAAKGLEVAAMLTGGLGLMLQSWPLILAMIFIMGFQSTFFSPALNGSIPEMFSIEKVPRVNAILKLATTLAILLGIAFAGVCLDLQWLAPESLPQFNGHHVTFGVSLIAGITVVVALIGFLTSFGLGRRPPAGGTQSFPWFGPVRSLIDLKEISADLHLLLGILCDAWFYFISVLAIQLINTLGIHQLHFSQTRTSLLSMSLMLGVCVGSFIASRLTTAATWTRWLFPSALGMGVCLTLASLTPLFSESTRFAWLLLTLSATGCAGGIFLIPTTTILQVRPKETEKGRVLSVASFCAFITILLAGILFAYVDGHFSPAILMAAAGAGAILFALLLSLLVKITNDKPPSACTRKIFAILLRRLTGLRYRVQVSGLEKIKKKGSTGILFLPNHPALIDPVIVSSQLLDTFAPRPLSDARQLAQPFVRLATSVLNPITIPDSHEAGPSAKKQILKGMQLVADALKNGDNILFYPAGRLNRSAQEDLGANSGVEYILKKIPGVQVVVVRSNGLWGSSFSHAVAPPALFSQLRSYLTALAANLLFFLPKRPVQLDFFEDEEIHHIDDRQGINRHLESLYNALPVHCERWPLYWWQGAQPELLPEPKSGAGVDEEKIRETLETVDDHLRKRVLEQVAEYAGTAVKGPESLSANLGLDSLILMELAAWIEREYGVTINDPGVLETANHCVLAAAGVVLGTMEKIDPPSQAWFAPREEFVLPQTLQGANIGEIFLQRTLKTPKQIIFADQTSGERSYRDLLTAVLLLQPKLKKISTKRVGIMLPASVGAAIAWLAVLLAGKTPVMFNWTSGIGNMKDAIKQTEVNTIISATRLCSRVEEIQGTRLSEMPVRWLQLDQLFPALTLTQKLCARLRSNIFGVWQLRRSLYRGSDEAVVLFTSGSEARPKVVPLSHENILANLLDVNRILNFSPTERIIGMLPPFHSLGLNTNIILPLLFGLKTIYYPNPTEPLALAQLIDAYKTSLMISTPTFLSAIVQAADGEQLASLRTIFVGAEAPPESLAARLAAKSPQAQLCEGYGITECSPLVALNPPEENIPGTLGRTLPSVEFTVVDDNLCEKRADNERGLLLVRGPSIFSGYIGLEPGTGFVEYDGKRWYNTDDFVSAEGDRITFLGRRKRFVKLGGEMISLPAIEAALLKGTEDAGGNTLAVVAKGGDGHPELVLITAKSSDGLHLDAANARIRAAGLSPLHHLRRVVHIDEIPTLSTGKTDYKSLGDMLKKGEVQPHPLKVGLISGHFRNT
ncbi:MAG: MFS transporter [Desulforhopalus sp.]|nr:MFS transporter [Desulforhopalus sp.]